MRWTRWIGRRLWILFQKEEAEAELAEEVAFHVEMETAELVGRGWDRPQARREALRRLGGVEPTKEWVREQRGGRLVDDVIQDVQHAMRGLRRSPGFTLSAVMVLALGIGANAAVFTVVNAILLKPAPYADPSRVVHVYQDSDDGGSRVPASSSFPATRDMATYTDVFSGVAAMSPSTLTWEADEGPRQVLVEYVTASYFPVLGIEPSLGRWFEPAADAVGGGNFALVSHRTWRTQLGADPDVIGRALRMEGQLVTVIGVGPEGFNGAGGPLVTDFWLSISSVGVGGPFRIANLERREDHWYDVRARLAPGVTVAQAQGAMDTLATRLAAEYPNLNRGRGITVFGAGEVRVHPAVDGVLLPVAVALLGIVGLVLVLACANLANLLIVRGFFRGHEVAVRRALGASRSRVARLFLSESILLSLMGGGVGILLGWWVLRFVPLVVGPAAAAFGGAGDVALSIDRTVLLYTLAITLVTGVLFGLAPALRSARSDAAGVLRAEGRNASPGRRATLLRNGLVVVQLAACLVLVVGASLLTQSLANVQRADPGVDAERLAYVATTFGPGDVSPEEQAVRLQELMDRAATLPGVTAVAFATRLPVMPGPSTTTSIEGYTPPSGSDSVELPLALVSDDYFGTVGVRVTAGRAFGPEDALGTTPVVIVNEAAARRFWGEADPVGRRLRPQATPGAWTQVVGVVEDIKVSSLNEPPTPMLFYPIRQSPSRGYVLVRTDADPATLLVGLREQLRAVSAELPLSALGTVAARLDDSLLLARVSAGLLGGFSLLAMLLASLGIYAVVSFSVARRSSEIGIRIALGAERSRVVRMVMREMLLTLIVGLAIGFAVALPAASLLQPTLYQVSALDGASFLVSALLLTAVAILATYIPARRAAGADPLEALRVQ